MALMAFPAPHLSSTVLGLRIDLSQTGVPLLKVFAKRAYSQGSTIAFMLAWAEMPSAPEAMKTWV